jgi:hypothetical protein
MVASSVAGERRRVTPSGLASSLATLAMNLLVPTPTEAVSPPVRSPSSVGAQSLRPARVRASGLEIVGGRPGGQVDEGLVEAERLDQRGELVPAGP